jgi:hypothetical protein
MTGLRESLSIFYPFFLDSKPLSAPDGGAWYPNISRVSNIIMLYLKFYPAMPRRSEIRFLVQTGEINFGRRG